MATRSGCRAVSWHDAFTFAGEKCPHPQILEAYEAKLAKKEKANMDPGSPFVLELIEKCKSSSKRLPETIIISWWKETAEADDLNVRCFGCWISFFSSSFSLSLSLSL